MKRTALFLAVLFCALLPAPAEPGELAYVDAGGVIRWRADDREVGLFGANYTLPSASDYRAAGDVGADRKKLVEQDMTHFARMGWDAMRLCLWGDWENSDMEGNLIVNDHLDLMDYAIAEAKKRGVFILLTPITTYGAWWPDAKASDPYAGFSNHYEKSELGTNPAAIAAQCNYLRQIFRHVNPYTGLALKDEPAILFVEMINEPWHHAEDLAGSVSYIEALAEAVRSTGCDKILFHNLSQDMRIATAIKTSTVPGLTFAWYPTGLNSGHELRGNHLRSVDDFIPMFRPDLLSRPKIVYEFDSPDMNSGYMYPAMARAFRGVGAQFATMFSYDMLATAPYNLGWQTHFLNLVYSPKKAVSAIIAAEVMREVPRYSHYGDYPDNRCFGPFRVSYEEDSSEMVTNEKFLYANDTKTSPVDPPKLRQIIGTGSSPVVDYEGNGAYFIDRLRPGLWRLEVYPDAVIVQDPFAQHLNYQTVASRLVWHEWPMTLRLPDLGEAFSVSPLNSGNKNSTTARAGRFAAKPGVYLLSREVYVDPTTLPQRIGQIGLDEFVCPAEPDLPVQILPAVRADYEDGQPLELAAEVISAQLPRKVMIQVRDAGEKSSRSIELSRTRGYRYAATLPIGTLAVGAFDYRLLVEGISGETTEFPTGPEKWFTSRVVGRSDTLILFDATHDITGLVYTRIGDNVRHGVFQTMSASETDPAALRLMFPLSVDRTLDDYTASLAIKDQIIDRRLGVSTAKNVKVKARCSKPGQVMVIALVEADGTTWSKALSLSVQWQDVIVPLEELKIDQGVLLPLGYPGRWDYWSTPAKNRGLPADHPRLVEMEHVQISFRPALTRSTPTQNETDAWADIASIALQF